MLRFPLRVGLTWSDRVKFQPTGMQIRLEDAKYEDQAWEKIKTSKGEFDAFKIVMTMRARGPPGEIRTDTYYYAPDSKAIASFDTSGSARVTSTLIDFSLSK